MLNKILFSAVCIFVIACTPKDDSLTPELSQHNKNMLAYYSYLEQQAEGEYVTFWGDSFIQSLLVNNVSPSAINLGIGTETSFGLLDRIKRSPKLIKHSSKIFIHIGVNDLKHSVLPETTASNIFMIVEHIRQQSDAPIFINELFPVDETKTRHKLFRNHSIKKINALLQIKAAKYANVKLIPTSIFVENGQLPPHFHRGDGLHLSPFGYKTWTELLRRQL